MIETEHFKKILDQNQTKCFIENKIKIYYNYED